MVCCLFYGIEFPSLMHERDEVTLKSPSKAKTWKRTNKIWYYRQTKRSKVILPECFRANKVLVQDLFEKKATLICKAYKTCTFSSTQRLDAICHCMLSIFDRNISFLVHIYSKKMLVAKWNDFMSPSSSAEMIEVDLTVFNLKIYSTLLVSFHMLHSV